MGSKAATPPTVTATESAGDVYAAQLKYNPLAAQQQMDIQRNPNYGTSAQTQLLEDIRRQLFPNETMVRDQASQNILQALQNPGGLTEQQQVALNARRGEAGSELARSMRERAAMGGNLYGGRSALNEANAQQDLQYQFAESDINRDQINRQNALQSALPLLQLLYPDVQLTPPQYTSPVASGDSAYSNLTSQRNTNAQIAAQNASNQSALMGSIFSGLGSAAGGAFTGMGTASAGRSMAAAKG
jgi:hypothetical protein